MNYDGEECRRLSSELEERDSRLGMEEEPGEMEDTIREG